MLAVCHFLVLIACVCICILILLCQMRIKNYKKELCREQGREITIIENTQTVHVSKPHKIPKDSPFKKLIKTAREDSNGSFSDDTPGPIYGVVTEESENDVLFELLFIEDISDHF